MKKIKKMLAILLSLVMLVGTIIPATAGVEAAEEGPKIFIDYTTDRDELYVYLYADSIADMATLDAQITYDSSLLSYDSSGVGNIKPSPLLDINDTNGQTNIALVSAGGVDMSGITAIVCLKYKMLFEGSENVSMGLTVSGCTDSQLANITVKTSSIENKNITSQKLPDYNISMYYKGGYNAQLNKTKDLMLTLSAKKTVYAIDATIEYDPTIFVYSGYTKENILENAVVDVNLVTPGKLNIGIASSDGIEVSGDILALSFVPILAASGFSMHKLTNAVITNSDMEEIEIPETLSDYLGITDEDQSNIIKITGPDEVVTGETFVVQAALKNNSGFAAATLQLLFDEEYVEYVSGEMISDNLTGVFGNVGCNQDGNVVIAMASSSNITGDGAFANITLRAKKRIDATSLIDMNIIELVDEHMSSLEAQVIPCAITSKHATYLTLKNDTMLLNIGGYAKQIECQTDSSAKDVVWKSADTSIATVDADGYVTAVGVGSVDITGTIDGYEAVCRVTIVENPLIIEDEEITIEKGSSKKLDVQIDDSIKSDIMVLVYSSIDEDIATVDTDGTIHAIAPGQTQIIAEYGIFSVICDVNVISTLTGITLDSTSATLNKGDTKQLIVSYNPTDTTDAKDVIWSSSNTGAVTVNASGLITAVGAGNATITAKVVKPGTSGETIEYYTAECSVEVKVPLKGITLDSSAVAMHKDGTKKLNVVYNPTDTTDAKDVIWSSSDTDVATVGTDGKVTAVGTGNAVISAKVKKPGIINATSDNDYFIATCNISVDIPLQGIALDVTSADLNKGDNKKLTVIYTPSNTTDNKNVIWRSSDDSVATVANDGTVTAVGAGNATITATVAKTGMAGNFVATCSVKVSIPLTGIAMNYTTAELEKDETKKLAVIYTPGNTTDDKTVIWDSSDDSVATVANDGTVTAVGAGSATITATCNELTATCVVTVNSTQLDLIQAFVQRMYTIVLNRDAEEEGMIAWTGFLENKQCTGAQMLQAFIEGKEFIGRNLSDEAFMNVMYRAVMGRESDVDGMQAWIGVLGNGMSRTFVLSGFVGSPEFTDICDSYGIDKGSVTTTEGRDRNYNVTCFVQRFYTKVLDRAAEVDGLNVWCNAILDKQITPDGAARLFVFSDETIARNLNDAEYIKMLYRTFMGRECESSGVLDGWVAYLLSPGQTRESVFTMFAGSKEFSDIVKSYGL